MVMFFSVFALCTVGHTLHEIMFITKKSVLYGMFYNSCNVNEIRLMKHSFLDITLKDYKNIQTLYHRLLIAGE